MKIRRAKKGSIVRARINAKANGTLNRKKASVTPLETVPQYYRTSGRSDY